MNINKEYNNYCPFCDSKLNYTIDCVTYFAVELFCKNCSTRLLYNYGILKSYTFQVGQIHVLCDLKNNISKLSNSIIDPYLKSKYLMEFSNKLLNPISDRNKIKTLAAFT